MRCALACWLAFLVVLGGCGVVDWATGIEVTEETLENGDVVRTVVDKPGDSPLEAVGKIGGLFFPGSDLVMGGLAAILVALRGRKYKVAAVATASTIEAFLKTPEGAAVADKLKDWLAHDHRTAGVYDIMKGIAEKVGKEAA